MEKKLKTKMYRKYYACVENDHTVVPDFTAGVVYPAYLGDNGQEYIFDDRNNRWACVFLKCAWLSDGTHFKEVFK